MYKNSSWIFFGGVDYDLTEGDLICVFSQWGEVVNIHLVRDITTGKSKGYGFLAFYNQKSTILAVDNANGIKLCGRVLRVDHCENYKIPKNLDKLDPETRDLIEKGCAPEPICIKKADPVDLKTKRNDDNDDDKRKTKKRKDSDEESLERDDVRERRELSKEYVRDDKRTREINRQDNGRDSKRRKDDRRDDEMRAINTKDDKRKEDDYRRDDFKYDRKDYRRDDHRKEDRRDFYRREDDFKRRDDYRKR